MFHRIPCVLMRGGTSRGPYLLASDLPADPARRDAVLLRIMGSPHPLQVDGIGGASSLTSKVAVVSASRQPGADVDYLFAQVSVNEAKVDTKPNCGNMLAGVGPFAIEAGLVAARDPETIVRIFNVNTSTLVEAVVQTPGGRVEYEGDTRIDGVNDAAAAIKLTFLNAMGAVTGKLLPTGRVLDVIDGVEASCVDMAMPVVIMAAEAFGKTGRETPAELDADRELLCSHRVDPPQGRPPHGDGRRIGNGGAQAGARFASARAGRHRVALLHAARLSSQSCGDRGARRRYRRRAAGERREPLRQSGRIRRRRAPDRAPRGRHPDRSRDERKPRSAARLAGAHRPADLRGQRARPGFACSDRQLSFHRQEKCS